MRELLHWSKVHCTPFPSSTPTPTPKFSKQLGLHDQLDRKDINDGIYCQGETSVRIPPLSAFCPTTPKIVIPVDDFICKNNQRPLLVQFRHSFTIQIDIIGAEPVVLTSGCYLISTGLKVCDRLLQDDIEIMPCMDYEKIIGLEVWVPEYHESDEYLRDCDTDSVSEHDSEPGESSKGTNNAGSDTEKGMKQLISVLKEQPQIDETRIPQLIEQAMQEQMY
jgi:hypothetical protein